jgi:O-antigen/teichoic acid export membrane protein
VASEPGRPRPPAAGAERSAAHEASERAAKNTAVRAAGEIIGKIGSLVLLSIMARQVGDERLGVFVFALAWGEVAMTPVGLGIDQFLLRQVAADRSRLDSYFWNAIRLKLYRGIPVTIGSIALVYALDYPRETELTVAIITVGLLLDTMARTMQNVFNAFERGELAASPIVAQRLVAAALGVALLLAGYGVVEVAIAYSLGALVRLLLSLDLMRRRLVWPAMIAPVDVRREIRRRSLTFTTQDVFGLVLARADVLLLAALATDAVVGQYGAAYRLFEATTFITVALGGAFTAMYTYLGPTTEPSLPAVFQRSIKLCLALLLPIGITLGLLAGPLCRSFFGDEFADAATPLRLLAPVVVLFGVMALCSVLVLSRSRPRRMVYTVAVAAAVNISLNLALIPPLEESGAALAMLLSMIVYVAIAFTLARIEVGSINWVSMLAAPGAATGAMALPLLLLSGIWPVAVAVGGIVYLAAYVMVDRLVDPDDLRFVVDLVKRRLPSRDRETEPSAA